MTYDAVIDVYNADLRLRPGMTANATVTYADKKDVLAVPNAALRFKPPPEANIPKPAGSAATAHRTRDPARRRGRRRRAKGEGEGRTTRRRSGRSTTRMPVQVPIKTGLSDGAYTEIVTGEPGDGDLRPAAAGPATDPPSGSVKEGDIVIVDATVAGKDVSTAAPTTTARRSPF